MSGNVDHKIGQPESYSTTGSSDSRCKLTALERYKGSTSDPAVAVHIHSSWTHNQGFRCTRIPVRLNKSGCRLRAGTYFYQEHAYRMWFRRVLFLQWACKTGRFGGFGIVELVPTSRRRCNSRVHKPCLRSDHARFPAMWEFHEQGLFFKMWLTRGCVFPSFFIFEVRVHKGRGRDV